MHLPASGSIAPLFSRPSFPFLRRAAALPRLTDMAVHRRARAEDTGRFRSLSDIDRPNVRVMVNPGGLNEAFARAKLPHAAISIHGRNEEIPSLVADGRADLMITEIVEAPWYVQHDPRLAAPLLDEPFTRGEIGVLMRKGQDDLLAFVNDVLARMAADGTLAALKTKYGLR